MENHTETPATDSERPAEVVPHKFVNSGSGRVRHIDVHAGGRMSTERQMNP